MGLLRAAADAVVIGAGNLRAERDHVWIADRICPELAPAYAALRSAMRKPPAPLQIIVTGRGDVDLSSAAFSSAAPSLVVTTDVGATRLAGRSREVPVAVADTDRGASCLCGAAGASCFFATGRKVRRPSADAWGATTSATQWRFTAGPVRVLAASL
jgi:riboflavin biosynthesis pyrimidine reductase